MPAQIQAGELDRRITILRSTPVTNAYNEPVETFVAWRSFAAKRRDASASESYRAVEVGAQITARFTVRFSSDTATITPKDRIQFDGRDYNITAARQVGRRRWIELDATARDDKR
jgi:SPP1 family predicted phage head-tail adaptor